MTTTSPSPDRSLGRRAVLAGTLGAAALVATGSAATATAAQPVLDPREHPTGGRRGGAARRDDAGIRAIEERHDRRVGVHARNLRTGAELVHRPDETFATCSTFKTLAVGAVLAGRLTVPDRRALQRRAYWPPSLVAGAGYAPRLQAWQDAGYAPTVAEVCDATVADSDNAGANLLLQLVGGPAGVTALARALGDRTTTLTRWEPDLNEWEPGQTFDVTSPRAIGRSHEQLLVGNGLDRAGRARLRGWMLANRTGDGTLRAGLPDGWTLASKTGSGARGTRNDVGVAWAPDGTPLLISCLTNGPEADSPSIDAPLAEVAARCVEALA
ncbi:class A beta-lactamase [Nocardioides zeae]|uniref:Beta-lactamase n=1 Tax=Nocardioides imazamoxiresistens TaxID=3231893 RepID=A0ABU3PZR9_9ACTN|nr:class A beta-lactamase [Nocardioides zeae]MDT9594714.1 class A beta-lactamase [Nocardioides zeae]